MPFPIVHKRANGDVDEIAAHIAIDHLPAALRFLDAAEKSFDLLAEFPGLGPKWDPPIRKFPELRFWPIKGFRNYLVIYRPVSNTVEILRVLHGAREIGRVLDSE